MVCDAADLKSKSNTSGTLTKQGPGLGSNAWVASFLKLGSPKHLITDHKGEIAVGAWLELYDIKAESELLLYPDTFSLSLY